VKKIRLIALSAIAVCVASCQYSSGVADEPERQDILVAVGASGSSEYRDMFQAWAERWESAAKTADADFHMIGLDDSDSDKAKLTEAIMYLTGRNLGERLWIILIGHGTFDGRTARFNLRGPDITAAETADLVKNTTRPIALINCTSGSAPFINAMSGPNRVILTATKDGSQLQLARFGAAMSAAIGSTEADLNRDGQVSLLEAWAFAARRTDEFYASNGRLATEHSLLDDNGDGLGSRLSVFKGVQLNLAGNEPGADGDLARCWYLIRSDDERRLTIEQSERRDELEYQLEEVKRQRDEYTHAEYLNQLESILIRLARLYQESNPPQERAKKRPIKPDVRE